MQKVGVGGEMKKKEFHALIGRAYHVPKPLKPAVLKELVNMKLVSNEGEVIIVNEPQIDLENTSKVYEHVGLY